MVTSERRVAIVHCRMFVCSKPAKQKYGAQLHMCWFMRERYLSVISDNRYHTRISWATHTTGAP